MSTIIKFIIGIIIIAIIIYFVIRYIYAKATIQDRAPEQINLQDVKQVYNSYDTQESLLSTAGSSIMAFVNCRFGDRTGKINVTSYIPLISINSAIVFEVTPESAQLRVTTTGAGQTSTEIIPIPPLPTQKWIFVSILRDGRRFDIMYNDQIVASHRLAQYPKIVSNPLIIGNKALLGDAVNVLVAPYRLTPADVIRQMRRLSDTSGTPVTVKTRLGLPPVPFISLKTACIPGMPCEGVTKPPSDQVKAWYSPYS